MQKSSFHIQAWDYEDPQVPLTHRHQLQPLQQIIDKSKSKSTSKKLISISPPIYLRNKDKYEIHDGRSFLSVRIKKKKLYSQQSTTKLDPNIKLDNSATHHNPLQDQYYSRKLNANSFFMRSIVTIIQKQPQPKKQYPKFILQRKKEGVINISQKKKKSKSTANLMMKYSKTKETNKTDISRTPTKQDSLRQLKTFFLRTIRGNENNQFQKQKDHEYRLKNMIQKSNRKKRQLEQLFKTRMLIGQNQRERRIQTNKFQNLFPIDRLLTKQKNRCKTYGKTFRDEFDDNNMYCPWNYKQQKLIKHMRAKHQD